MLCDFGKGIFVRFIKRKIQQNFIFFQIVCQLFEFINFIRKGCALFQDGFGFFRIIPESIFGDILFDFSQPVFFARKVKDSPAGLTVFVEGPLSFVLVPQTFYLPPQIGLPVSQLSPVPVRNRKSTDFNGPTG